MQYFKQPARGDYSGGSSSVLNQMGNDLTSQLIYSVSKYFPCEFMAAAASFKSSLMQSDVHFVNKCLIPSKKNQKTENVLGGIFKVVFIKTRRPGQC